MLWTIVKQEILDHLTSERLSAIFVLALLLMVSGALVFSGDYRREVDEYPRTVGGFVDDEGKVSMGSIACNSGASVRRFPSPLGFCSGTGDREMPNQVGMALHRIYALQRSAEPGEILSGPEIVDWTFVIAVLLSFGAGLLTYKSISGERRDGTLTLLLANPVPRNTVLLGKYLAALLALATALVAAMLSALIVLQSLGTVPLGPDEWLKIALFGLVGVVYLSLFVLTGLLCSIFTRSPVLSAVAFLFVWTVLVFVIPNVGGLAAGWVGSVRTPLQMHEAERTIPDQFSLTAAMSADEVASIKRRRESASESLLLGYLQSLVHQVQLGQDCTRISPASLFSYAAERIVGGGTFRLVHFVDNAVRYREGLYQAVIEADRRDPQSEHRYVPWWCGGNHFSRMTVDPGPAKEFHDTFPSGTEGLVAASWDLLLLVLYNLIAFAVAFWRFARQEVAPAPGV